MHPDSQKAVKNDEETVGKNFSDEGHDLSQDGCNFRQLKEFLLPAMPILRSFTDNMLSFIQQVKQLGWDHQVPILRDLKQEVRDLNLTLGWQGRPFLKTFTRHIYTQILPKKLGQGSSFRLAKGCKHFRESTILPT